MEFSVFKVGQVYQPAVGIGEGVKFTLSKDGALLLYSFDSPAAEEVAEMKAGKGFEIRFVTLGGIIWVMSKCGDLDWADAPYNPRLVGALPEEPEGKEGTALTLVMVDSRSGVVKSVRLIGLGSDFSRALLKEATEVRSKAMTVMDANRSINNTMMRYDTKSLVRMAPSYARFKL